MNSTHSGSRSHPDSHELASYFRRWGALNCDSGRSSEWHDISVWSVNTDCSLRRASGFRVFGRRDKKLLYTCDQRESPPGWSCERAAPRE